MNILRKLTTKLFQTFERDFSTLNRIEVSRDAILHNYDLFQGLLPDFQIWPVLKANAYGHDIKTVSSIVKERDFEYVILDGYFEALKVWEVSDHKVLLIGYMHPLNLKNIDFSKVALTVYDVDTIKALGQLKREVKIHLKVDTGMNRQGIEVSDVVSFIKEIQKHPHIKLEGILSHFADADGENDRYTDIQKKRFSEVIGLVKNLSPETKYFHLGATAGSLKTKNMDANAVRLGFGLYGFNPLSKKDPLYQKLKDLKPALRFISKLINVKEISKGEKVSYNCTFEAPRDMKIGVLPLGYYEGLDRRLSNNGFVKYKGRFLPIIGRVCMNLTVVDLIDTGAEVWDEVEVISGISEDKNSIESIAKTCGTIPYEVLVKLSESVRRKAV